MNLVYNIYIRFISLVRNTGGVGMNHIDGDKTTLYKKVIQEDNYTIEDNPNELLDFIDRITYDSPLIEGIKSIFYSSGYAANFEDVQKRNDYFIDLAIKNGAIDKTDINGIKAMKVNLSHWLDRGPVDNADSRKSVYRFCCAFAMGIEEIEEFFLYKCLMRPFNLRNRFEAALLYVLSKNGTFLLAEELDRKVSSKITLFSDIEDETVLTDLFRSNLLTIKDEDNFIDYCVRNDRYFKNNNITAVNIINDTLNYLIDYYMRTYKVQTVSTATLLKYLYYGSEKDHLKSETKEQITYQSSNGLLKLLKKNQHLSRNIYKGLPSEETISKIKNEKKVTSDILRKTIIMLYFFEYFIDNSELCEVDEGLNVDESFQEFNEQLDCTLDECGFGQIYARNPYDWVFLYCAEQEYPLDCFRDLIQCYIGSTL